MRSVLLSALIFAVQSPNVLAQDKGSLEQSDRITYFLIDASGSMNTRATADQAEQEVSKILEPLKASNPNALVSRTYFRAANRDLCSVPVSIATPVPALVSNREFITSGNNDYTPLGMALESAINIVAGRPADIVLISDGIQTSDCGPDICDVARRLLPVPGIRVSALQISNDGNAGSRLACVTEAEAQTREAAIASNNVPTTLDENKHPGTLSSHSYELGFWIKAFFRAWFWLFAVLAIAAAALAFGWRQSHAARILEENTKRVRSYQDLARSGDKEAEEKMQLLIDTIEKPKMKGGSFSKGQRIRETRARVLKLLSYLVGVLGVVMLVGLAMLPPKIFGLSLKGTKQSAWDVFDSDFATAFAVLIIAIIFYAGTQLQRRQEARHNFAIVSEEAIRSAAREQDESRRASFEAYEKQFDKFAALRFPISAPTKFVPESDPELASYIEDATLIIERAKGWALRHKLERNSLPSELDKETRRIEELNRKVHPFWWSNATSFMTLIDELIKDESISTNIEIWRAVSATIQAEGLEQYRDQVRQLAKYIREHS